MYLNSSSFPIKVFTDHNPLTFVHRMKTETKGYYDGAKVHEQGECVVDHANRTSELWVPRRESQVCEHVYMTGDTYVGVTGVMAQNSKNHTLQTAVMSLDLIRAVSKYRIPHPGF